MVDLKQEEASTSTQLVTSVYVVSRHHMAQLAASIKAKQQMTFS